MEAVLTSQFGAMFSCVTNSETWKVDDDEATRHQALTERSRDHSEAMLDHRPHTDTGILPMETFSSSDVIGGFMSDGTQPKHLDERNYERIPHPVQMTQVISDYIGLTDKGH